MSHDHPTASLFSSSSSFPNLPCPFHRRISLFLERLRPIQQRLLLLQRALQLLLLPGNLLRRLLETLTKLKGRKSVCAQERVC